MHACMYSYNTTELVNCNGVPIVLMHKIVEQQWCINEWMVQAADWQQFPVPQHVW